VLGTPVADRITQVLTTARPAVPDIQERPIPGCTASTSHTSIAYTERLASAGVAPSVGSVGDAYDNALAESTIGLFKTELIKPRRPWRNVEQVEIATLEYIDWFNNRRLHSTAGDLPPAELEAAHDRVNGSSSPNRSTKPRSSPDTPGRFTRPR
jgi:transposase InsO family protein